jgi:hypothetical protein
VATTTALALVRRWVLRAWRDAEHDCALMSPGSRSSSYNVTSFHKLNFDQNEIMEALIDKNIVGHGQWRTQAWHRA